MNLKPGTTVHIADGCGPLGVLESPDDSRFADDLAYEGDECEVISYDGQLPDGWIIVLHRNSNKFAPVQDDMLREGRS